MKIAYLFAYFGDGGAEENAILLAQKAKESGNDVIFIIDNHSNESLKRLRKDGLRVLNLPMASSFNPIMVLKSVVGLKNIIRSEHIDIVHSHMLREQSLAITAKIIGVKFALIRTFHRLDQFNWKMRPLMPIYRKFTDAVISISDNMSSYLKANSLVKNVYLIKNGVAKISISKHDKALGFIGRLTAEKGILDFIKANIDILRDNKLVIAGDGPDLGAIKKVIDDNKLNVELIGWIQNKTDFFKKISVLILPSSTEVLPLVIIEAYSCGLPVIAFDLDSLKDLIGADNGMRIDYPNYAKMGQNALELLDRSESYYKSNITKYESEYSVDLMWNKTSKLYKSLLNE